MPDERDFSTGNPSCAGGAGASDEVRGGLFSRERGPRPPATRKQVAIRRFAKAMRHAQTEPESKLWTIVRDRRFSGFKFRRQVLVGSYIVDFVCFERRLVVEADGSQHGENGRDTVRDAWLKAQGFRIRRFWNADIMLRPTEVKETLWADLDGQTDL